MCTVGLPSGSKGSKEGRGTIAEASKPGLGAHSTKLQDIEDFLWTTRFKEDGGPRGRRTKRLILPGIIYFN